MRHSFTRLVLSVAVGVALMGGAFSVHAASLTTDQISSIIGLLRSFGADAATITQVSQALGGQTTTPSSSVSCVDITRTLTVDSQGSDVTNLQAYLIAKGYLAAGNATGFYGPLTAQAVGKLQLALGLITSASDSAYGILGPKTRAAIACTPQQPPTETPTPTQNPAPTQNPVPSFAPITAPTTAGSGAPTITQFSVSPSSVTKWATATISWASTNTSSCTVTRQTGDNYNIDMTQVTYNAGTGMYSVPTGRLGQTGTYQLSCVSPAGVTVTSTAGVTVTDSTYAPIPNPAINSFTASPATVTGGSTSALAWSVSNAIACTVTPTSGDMRPVTYTGVGASAVTPAITQTTTYQLTCQAFAGSTSGPVSRSVTVNYQTPTTPTPTPTTQTPTPTVPNPTISSLTASPTTVVGGNAAALAWSASNTASCTISPISGDMRAVTYTSSASATTPAITQSTTYQLTCTPLAGATGGAATRTVTVNYQAPVTTPTPTPTQGAATITISKPAPNTVYTMGSFVTAVIDYTNATFPSQAYVRFDLLKPSITTTKKPSNSYTTQQLPSANGTNSASTFATGIIPFADVPGTYIINAELRKCNPAGCMNNTQAEWSLAPYATATPVTIELR